MVSCTNVQRIYLFSIYCCLSKKNAIVIYFQYTLNMASIGEQYADRILESLSSLDNFGWIDYYDGNCYTYVGVEDNYCYNAVAVLSELGYK